MTLVNGALLAVIVVLSLLLLWEHKWRRKQVRQMQRDYLAEAQFHNQLWTDNETLRAYMDNKHLVWNDVTKETINKRPMDPDIVILIRAIELYDLTQTQWRDGYDMAAVSSGKAMQMRYGVDNQVEEDDGVVKMRASFADKRFDNDFAKLVNATTSIAVNYGTTQQCRDRISRQIIDFRMYLAKKQRGERVEFPKM